MQEIYVIGIEPLPTRYSAAWYYHVPKLIESEFTKQGKEVNVIIIDGDDVPPVTTPGAFLDFGATNIFKNSQMSTIAELFRQNKIKPNSKFLFTDAWNPTVLQLKYMSSLLQIPVEIHGLWHANSSDSFDFLGRLIGNKPWIKHAELSMFNCYDYNWFASRFYIGLFGSDLLDVRNIFRHVDLAEATMSSYKNIKLTGWPMEYLQNDLLAYSTLTKKQQICFPHRIAPEKQLNIFEDLALALPEYNWVVCQKTPLTKHEYHTILGESKIVFSASNQETLGISTCFEGPLCNAIPLAPDRLSYSEIFKNYPEFLYPSEWTTDFNSYITHKNKLVNHIRMIMNSNLDDQIKKYTANDMLKYSTASELLTKLSS